MAKQPISLVAVDMDGTFLRPDKTYDRDRFLVLRQRMRQAGIRFVVASGNQYWQLKSKFEASDDVAYAAENGHFLYDVGESDPLYAPQESPSAARDLLDILESHRIPYVASTAKGALIPSWMPEEDAEWARLYFHRLDEVQDMFAHAGEIVKAGVHTPDPNRFMAEFCHRLPGAFVPVIAGPEDVDFNVVGHDKAVGLKRLADHWGINLAHAIAFGDNFNDMEMLNSVGFSVAMANAAQEIRDAVDRVAPSNAEDGVLQVLEEILP
ncbi:MAG: Cof-type HAD-IIB family hydrolase [Ancrocorticia sp.]|uniref:Cof-type HAD-IIB family hydrolase n=1 Tax=Ancrocorticia sp. TaxID=2593684 RepID=UPI003F92237A